MKTPAPLQWENGRLIPIMDLDTKEFPGEEWKDIPGYDYYQMSNYGRFRSLSRFRYDVLGREYWLEGKILKLTARKKNNRGHVDATVKVGPKQHTFSVARMVHYLFNEDFDWEDRRNVVVKTDGNDWNCHYKNLKLVTVSKNIKDDYKKGRKGGFSKMPVHQYDTTGRYMRTYPSILDAALEFKVNHGSLYTAAQLKNYRCRGYYWRLETAVKKIDVANFNAKRQQHAGQTKKAVQQTDTEGNIIAVFESMAFAARELNIDINRVRRACRSGVGKVHDYFLGYVAAKPG